MSDEDWRGGSAFFTVGGNDSEHGSSDKYAGGNYTGGDGLSTNVNRAFAWFIAGIVASVIVSILLMIAAYLIGVGVDFKGDVKVNASPAVVLVTFILSAGIGFAIAGSVYEGWVGCKSAA
jgi:hypothetical protein